MARWALHEIVLKNCSYTGSILWPGSSLFDQYLCIILWNECFLKMRLKSISCTQNGPKIRCLQDYFKKETKKKLLYPFRPSSKMAIFPKLLKIYKWETYFLPFGPHMKLFRKTFFMLEVSYGLAEAYLIRTFALLMCAS